jgi:hypothetical protein
VELKVLAIMQVVVVLQASLVMVVMVKVVPTTVTLTATLVVGLIKDMLEMELSELARSMKALHIERLELLQGLSMDSVLTT